MESLTEKEAENFLEKRGFNVVERFFIKDKKAIKNINLNFPWAMKLSSKKIMHKAVINGVYLNIKDKKEAEKAFEKISKINGFEEVIIQPMIKGEHLIIGLKNTPEFGMTVMFGKGGSNVEAEKDISFRILPITENDAEQMINEIKFYKTLKEKKINLKAIKENLMKVSKLSQNKKDIAELDINPLIVNNQEAKIIDARIIFE